MLRPAAVAGSFYPAQPRALRDAVSAFLAEAEAKGPAPKAMIVPHAGYIYSGAVAASAYARLRPVADSIKRVVLLGPSHRVGFQGLAVSSAEAYATPLGAVALDRAAIQDLLALPYVTLLDQAHAQEHSLEVQLPFLQTLLADFSLLPIVVGDASADQVCRVLAAVWGGPETLIVISSDLSHYHDYASAQALDSATSQSIEALQYQNLSPEAACGCLPIRGLLKLLKQKALSIKTVDLRNSGDTAGDKQRVVGYGAYVVD